MTCVASLWCRCVLSLTVARGERLAEGSVALTAVVSRAMGRRFQTLSFIYSFFVRR